MVCPWLPWGRALRCRGMPCPQPAAGGSFLSGGNSFLSAFNSWVSLETLPAPRVAWSSFLRQRPVAVSCRREELQPCRPPLPSPPHGSIFSCFLFFLCLDPDLLCVVSSQFCVSLLTDPCWIPLLKPVKKKEQELFGREVCLPKCSRLDYDFLFWPLGFCSEAVMNWRHKVWSKRQTP